MRKPPILPLLAAATTFVCGFGAPNAFLGVWKAKDSHKIPFELYRCKYNIFGVVVVPIVGCAKHIPSHWVF